MFEESGLVAAILLNRKIDEELADRRAFNGPDVQPEFEPQRRRRLMPRFLRRKDVTVA